MGYGCRDVSEKQRVIAVLPVGYADGLNRKLGNGNGYLFIKGRRVEIAGNICMDMCMADITGLDAAEEMKPKYLVRISSLRSLLQYAKPYLMNY